MHRFKNKQDLYSEEEQEEEVEKDVGINDEVSSGDAVYCFME